MEKQFATFDEFWPFYVQQHENKLSRTLHVAGTTVAMALVATAIVRRRAWPLLVAPVAGYGLAWAGHLMFEKNMPTSFSHPIWALRAGLQMWLKTMTGQMDAEVVKCRARRPDADADDTARSYSTVN
jgi:hypothetical protein